MMQRRFVLKAPVGWEGVDREGYVPGESSRVIRNTLIGHRKKAAADAGPALEVRYFEVPPGCATRLEKHQHEHFVIVGEGIGQAIVGSDLREVRANDVVYVGPLEPHQFVNRGAQTFGFYCVVTAHRDGARPVDGRELDAIVASPAGSVVDKAVVPRPREP